MGVFINYCPARSFTMELYSFLKNYNVHCTVSKYTAECLKMARSGFLNIQDFNFWLGIKSKV